MRYAAFILLAISAECLFGAVTLELGTTYSRNSSKTYPQSTSGLTYAGGDLFYAVADDRGDLAANEGGLYAYRISLSNDGKTLSSVTQPRTNDVVKLANGYDQEGCAYDPATGYVWVSDEVRKTIRAYDPTMGALKETLDYPQILKDKAVGNFAVEGLTISGDGLTMWFANEEALTCDGSRSSYSSTTTVRLFKFTRENVHAKFKPAGQYPYATEKWKCQYDYESKARHGVAGLCALPDGSLLVLERDLSFSSTSGFDIFFGASWLGWAVYRVENPEWATDVTTNTSLTANTSWTAVSKTLLTGEGDDLTSYGNFEGICLGPRLANGKTSVLLISDAGDGWSSPMIKPLVLSGLDIRTLDFPSPASGDVPSVVGSNYRYLNGKEVEVTLEGRGLAPVAYTNRGARVATASWSLKQSGRSGEGASAEFDVKGDDTLEWTVLSSVADTPIIADDSFEGYAVGTSAESLPGWTEAGSVVAETYAAPSVGVPMQRTTHTKVLAVEDGTSRTYESMEGRRQQLDMMAKVVRMTTDRPPDLAGRQACVWFAADGRCHVVHAAEDGTLMDSVVSQTAYANGDWVRVSMSFDYTVSAPAFTLRLNGEYCGAYRCLGEKRRMTGFDITGETALDDVIFTDGNPAFEVSAKQNSTVPKGVVLPQMWLDRYGIAWNDTESDADGDSYNVWQEYLADTSPLDDSSFFAISDFKVDGTAVTITLTGDLPRPDLLKLKWCSTLGGAQSDVVGTVTTENGISFWRATVPPEARFFRAYLCE